MKLVWKRNLVTVLTNKKTNQKHEIRTTKLSYEPNFFFEKRHRLKVRAKKYWLSKVIE